MSEELKKQKDQAYSERNKILAAFVWTLFRTNKYSTLTIGLAKHPKEDKSWQDDWRNILVIETPEGQLTWHFHDSEMYLFEGLPYLHNYKWDGHSTEIKYERLLRFFV